jgi:hypothetical protein
VALVVHTPGPMGEGNWSLGAYIDQRADDEQTNALGAIFTGAAGGPIAQLAPLVGKNLGVRKVPITYRIDGKRRSAEIPNILHMAVDPLPTAHPSGEMWANIGHPVSPDRIAFAVGAPGNTFSDHGMRLDNSGKNGLYAPIRWSNRSIAESGLETLSVGSERQVRHAANAPCRRPWLAAVSGLQRMAAQKRPNKPRCPRADRS